VARKMKRESVRAMGYDEETAERVRRILSGRRDVVENKMVAGLSFMANSKIFCGLAGRGISRFAAVRPERER
jgi:hypothetical protein